MIYLPLRPGIYRHSGNGAIYRVRLNRSRANVYPERWKQIGDRFGFVYEPLALDGLRAEDRMSLDEARAISREVGQCLACVKLLTDPKSQAAGIGPKCAKLWTYEDAVRGIVFGASAAEIEAAEERSREAPRQRARRSVRARLDGDKLVITSDYDELVIRIVRSFQGARWNGTTWSLPREHAAELAEAFEAAGIVHDDVAAVAMGWVA